MLKIFTDGSTFNNGKKNAVGGIGIYIPKLIYKLSLQYLLDTATNQRCELYAIVRALELVLSLILEEKIEENEIVIYTDSEYSINACTKWIKQWKINNWKTSQKKPVANVHFIIAIDNMLSIFKMNSVLIKFQHIRSHQNPPKNSSSEEYENWKGNDIADKLALTATKILDSKIKKAKFSKPVTVKSFSSKVGNIKHKVKSSSIKDYFN